MKSLRAELLVFVSALCAGISATCLALAIVSEKPEHRAIAEDAALAAASSFALAVVEENRWKRRNRPM